MFGMTISWTNLSLSVLGPRSRSQWLFLEKHIVIALAPLFIDKFWFYFTRIFSMTISWTSLSLSVLGPRSRSQWLFLEKHCHRSSALIYYPISINFTQVLGMTIPQTSSRFSTIGSRSRPQWLFLEKPCNWKLVRLQREKNLTSSFIFITKGDNKIYGN